MKNCYGSAELFAKMAFERVSGVIAHLQEASGHLSYTRGWSSSGKPLLIKEGSRVKRVQDQVADCKRRLDLRSDLSESRSLYTFVIQGSGFGIVSIYSQGICNRFMSL